MSERDGRYDFDVLHGRWRLRNERLVDRLHGSTTWWSIHWANTVAGALLPPTGGRFDGSRGDFHGHEVIDGRYIKVHVVWAAVDTDRPTWEQAFSADGGGPYETNWRMTFKRMETA